MVKQRKLESLPLEVIHQIFRYLSPSDLTSLRLTRRSISFFATSNHLWQLHCQSLWKSKICLRDCRDIPPSVWAFSLVVNGWFRAFSKVLEIAHSQWLLGEEALDNTIWMVFFKSSLVNANTWPLTWHVLVECSDTKIVSAIDGLPLKASKWFVDDRPSFRVTAYPPNIPSRDPSTWCRIMQHVQVLMISDAPEFLHGLANLDSIIRSEASDSKECECQNFNKILVQIVERRQVEIRDRLSNILAVRADICIGDDMATLSNFSCRE